MDFLPRDTPASYLREIQRTETEKDEEEENDDPAGRRPCRPPVLVCVGDSLTHGSVSADWVSSLSSRLLGGSSSKNHSHPSHRHFRVLNAGKNSETAAAVRSRLDEIVEVRPDAIALLVGTNDLIGSLDPSSAGVMYQRKLWWAQTAAPSLEGYEKELRAIVHELDARLEGPGTRIVVLSPPPLGEGGPGGRAWREGERMAEICSEICEKSSDRVEYIPLYDAVRDEMADALSPPPQQQTETQQLHPNKRRRREFSYRDAIPLTSVVVPWRIFLGQPFDKIRKATGYEYTIDGIHFGQEFADTVEDAVASWITSW